MLTGKLGLVELCLDKGMDINRVDSNYGSLLHAAAHSYEPYDETYSEGGTWHCEQKICNTHEIVQNLLERGKGTLLVFYGQEPL